MLQYPYLISINVLCYVKFRLILFAPRENVLDILFQYDAEGVAGVASINVIIIFSHAII
jgi:hypothetical protein